MKPLKKLPLLGLFALFGFLLYGNTLNHDFTLDDAIVITENDFTKKGFAGIWDQLSNDQFVGFYGVKKDLVAGGRYRPLSMVVFNIQYAIAGKASPFLGHLTNVLFYILNGFLLFLILQRLLSRFERKIPYLNLPLLISLIWFFHPIHTEVVSNIKGLDEMMAFAFELTTLWFVLNYLDSKKITDLLLAFTLFFLGLLSKENTVTWLAIIPLAVYFFTDSTFKKAIPAYASLLTAIIVWAAVRYQVVGGGISAVADNIMNDPFLEATTSEKYATIMLTLGKYIQLLFFPHPLTYDYYPKHIPIVGWGNKWVIFSLLTYLVLGAFAIWGLLKKHIVSFAILIFGISLSIASNIVFVIGAFMNERFVYVSSVGFAMALGYFIYKLIERSPKNKNIALGFIAILLGLYSFKTIDRAAVWKDNLTLSTTDAKTSINGAKSNIMAGGILTENAVKLSNPAEKKRMLQEGMVYLNRALTAYPDYIDALILMGNAQWQLHNSSENAMPYYYRILSINPNHQNTWQNAFIILEQEKNVDNRIAAYQTLLRYNPNKPKIYLNLGRAFGREKNDLVNAKKYLEIGLQLDPNNYDILTNLGTLYGLSQDFQNSIRVLTKAIQLQPNVAKTHVDLGLSYFYSGQQELAKAEFDKAVQLDNTINRSQFPI